MPRNTGFPVADAQTDFLRARRQQVLAKLARRLVREPDDVNMILPFDEVVAALGRTSEKKLGLQSIPLRSIVGSVDRTSDFDRRFRPTSARVRARWETVAVAERRGDPIAPIEVYRVGDLHFVHDGHHRVSVAHALGRRTIDAYVTEVRTRLPAKGIKRRRDLVLKDYERTFRDRVPLPASAYAKIVLTDPWGYTELGEAIEAWGFRFVQHVGVFVERGEVARRWLEDEYKPVVHMLRQASLVGDRTEAEAYLLVARERYKLIRTHEWSEEIIERLRGALTS
jgi:hypothetical protein